MDRWETSTSKQMPFHIHDSTFWICFSGFLGDMGSCSFVAHVKLHYLWKIWNSPLVLVGFTQQTAKEDEDGEIDVVVEWGRGGFTWQWTQSHGKTWQKREDSCGWRLRGKRIRENVADGLKTNANIDLWYHFYLLCHCLLESTSRAHLVCWVLR